MYAYVYPQSEDPRLKGSGQNLSEADHQEYH